MNKLYNETRVNFEKEKIDIFKRQSLEVKSWKRDLGKMTKKCIKLERKIVSLEESNSVSSSPNYFSPVFSVEATEYIPVDEAASHQWNQEKYLCYKN